MGSATREPGIIACLLWDLPWKQRRKRVVSTLRAQAKDVREARQDSSTLRTNLRRFHPCLTTMPLAVKVPPAVGCSKGAGRRKVPSVQGEIICLGGNTLAICTYFPSCTSLGISSVFPCSCSCHGILCDHAYHACGRYTIVWLSTKK